MLNQAVSWESWICLIPISTSPCQVPTCSGTGSTSHWNGKGFLLGSGHSLETIPGSKAPFVNPLQCLGLAKPSYGWVVGNFPSICAAPGARHPVFHVTRSTELKIQPHVFHSGSLGMWLPTTPTTCCKPWPSTRVPPRHPHSRLCRGTWALSPTFADYICWINFQLGPPRWCRAQPAPSSASPALPGRALSTAIFMNKI